MLPTRWPTSGPSISGERVPSNSSQSLDCWRLPSTTLSRICESLKKNSTFFFFIALCDHISSFDFAFMIAKMALKSKLPELHLKYALFLEDEVRY